MGRAALRAAGAEPAARVRVWTVEEAVEALARASGQTLTGYQRAYLADASPLRAVLKARQMGFSWLFALEALAHALAYGRFSIFVSLNREEAAEKVGYALDLYEALPEEERPPLLRAGVNEIRLGGGGRLLSFPCRAPRGKANASLYLDEMAFYPKSESVYAGALPVVSHGGRVTLASTPCGDRGMFWRAVASEDLASQFSLHRAPWWVAPWFCTDVDAAVARADAMETDERVRRFGTPVLARLCAAMDRNSFRQEYELAFLDTEEALIPWDEIEAAAEDYALAATWQALAGQGARLYAGMDIGRIHDPTEIVVLGLEAGTMRVRAIRSMHQTPFDQQEETAAELLRQAPVACLCLDATGMGVPIGESLARRFPGRVLPLPFTSGLKNEMASRAQYLMQNRELRIPRDRSLMEQIHAVRRTITDGGHVRLDAPREGGHHADKFWALALALHAAQGGTGGVRAQSVRAVRA